MATTTIFDREQYIRAQFSSGKIRAEIIDELAAQGVDRAEATTLVEQIRTDIYTRQRKKGMPLIAVGAMLCLAGLVITLFCSEINTAFHVGLFGCTGSGATLVIVGLMVVLG